ncbi:MAG: methylenetetrahydrofolate--tRNA-(uracil(54)-C(5))-methyltransferase (FADH(2)-oxidizing) TrmFO, partial [Collinsella sp.]|nr:methylenetetrahydrofolate--tRNA-(uracil(54)-C(5))-methyltransferase (FADH(2)-oxidizing) TrmFO [Collinsella sp.]
DSVELPRETVLGALVSYATDPETTNYQPMHVNFGIIPPLEDGIRRSKRDRYAAYSARGARALDAYLAQRPDLFAAHGR